MERNKIKVYTGSDIGRMFYRELTPLMYVQEAVKILNFNTNWEIACNSPDFCSAIYHISKLDKYKNAEVEFYINGVLSTLEEVFEEFNKALDLINEICDGKK